MKKTLLILLCLPLIGSAQWINFYLSTNDLNTLPLGVCVEQANDGGYILTGSIEDSLNPGTQKILLLKTDVNGAEEWRRIFDIGDYYQYGISISQIDNGGYILTGQSAWFFNNPLGSHAFWLIETNSLGTLTSTFNIPISSSNRELEKVVDILGRDINPEKNKPFIEIYNDGTVEKKIIIE